MAEIIDNEAINNRLNDENNEPAELPSAYTGQGWEYKEAIDPLQNLSSTPDSGTVSVTKVVAEAKVRKPRTVTPAKSTPSAKVIVSDAVQRLKDKIVALEYINGIVIGDLPAAAKINKDIRDNIVQFQKDVEKLKADWLYKIHKI